MKMPREREQPRNILFVFSFCTIALAAGLVYGWPALRRNLVTNEGSTLTENQLGIIFTVGSWTTHGGRFFSGILRDWYFGTRTTTCICLCATVAGCIGIAFCSENNMAALTASFFLIGLGSGAQICLQPVAGLFSVEYQGSVLASFSGSFQLAGLVFVALTSITIDRKKSFGPFALCLGLLVLLAYQLLPSNNFMEDAKEEDGDIDVDGVNNNTAENANARDKGDEENRTLTENNDEQEVAEKDQNEDSTCGISLVNRGDDDEDEENRTTTNDDDFQEVKEKQDLHEDTCGVSLVNRNEDGDVYHAGPSSSVPDEPKKSSESIPVSVLHQIRSAEYIFLVLWFSIQLIPLQYYVATIGFQLERKGDDDGKYTRLFSVLYASVAIFAPVIGKIADMIGLGSAQAIATVLSSFSLFFLTLDAISLDAHVAGMFCYGLGRMMVFGMFFTNVGKRFGYGNYGTLAGLGLLLSAIASLLQYPLISLAAGGSETIVNLLSALLMAGLGLPYNVWLWRREKNH